jgi:hypothetical protein
VQHICVSPLSAVSGQSTCQSGAAPGHRRESLSLQRKYEIRRRITHGSGNTHGQQAPPFFIQTAPPFTQISGCGLRADSSG